MKRCSKCDILKDESEFHNDITKTDGKRTKCKACAKIYYTNMRRSKGLKSRHTIIREGFNICIRCDTEKPLSEFHRNKRFLCGHTNTCKQCTLSKMMDERRAAGIKPRRHRSLSALLTGFKLCLSCEIKKTISGFTKNKAHVDGLEDVCKVCLNKRQYNRRRAKGIKIKPIPPPASVKGHKVCIRCLIEKPSDLFYNGNVCKTCVCERSSISHVKISYGITLDVRDAVVERQGNRCPLCGDLYIVKDANKRPVIDHCHVTGFFRGVLCDRCNISLNDDVEYHYRAIEYLANFHRKIGLLL